MSKIFKAVKKNDIKQFSESLTKKLNNEKELQFESYNKDIGQLLFSENLIVEEPTLVKASDKIDPSAEYFFVEMTEEDEKVLNEFERVVKINSKGKKRIKKMCGKGFKLVDGKCVKQNGNDKATMRKAQKKRKKTLKSSASTVKKSSRLRKKAMKQRKARGL